jgi:hypothetical protein
MRNRSVRLSNGRSAKTNIANIRRLILKKQIEIDVLKSSISFYEAKLRECECKGEK